MNLLIDMNLSPRWVERLTTAGHLAIHWSSVGHSNATDNELMSYAAKHDFVVITQDLDFGAILAATRGKKPSVIQIRSDNLSPHDILELVLAALDQTVNELASGALVTIDAARARLRLLPLRSEDV